MKPKIDNHYDIIPLIRERWSPRAFSDKKVEDEMLNRLFEAARWAPSCFNDQPWHFLVGVKGSEMYDKLFSTLVEANQVWVENAPCLVVSVARTTFAKNDKPNKHAWHDIGLAVSQLTVQASHEGVFVHQMAGFDAKKVKEQFDLPDNYEAVTAFVIGYLGDSDMLSEKLKKSEVAQQTRKPQSEFVFRTDWNKP